MAPGGPILNEEERKNLSNIRAISVLFMVLGALFLMGGLALANGGGTPTGSKTALDHPAFGYAMAFVGLCGVVGGFGTLTGSRKYAPLSYVMASFYLLAFPIGTILSVVLFKGMRQYLDSVDKIYAARQEGSDTVGTALETAVSTPLPPPAPEQPVAHANSAESILGTEEHNNYRNVRAISVLFVALGLALTFAGLALLLNGDELDKKKEIPFFVVVLMSVIGPFGLIGGVAALAGRRTLAPLMYAVAAFYIFLFPVGTLLSVTLFKGLKRYLASVEKLKLAKTASGPSGS